MNRQAQTLKIVTDELTKYGITKYETGYTGRQHQKIWWHNAEGVRRTVVTSLTPSNVCWNRIRADVRRILRQDGVIQ